MVFTLQLLLKCNFLKIEITNNFKSTLICLIFNYENHEYTVLFSLGPFSKQMDKDNFLNLKSSEIG